jgi:hypothetical protein
MIANTIPRIIARVLCWSPAGNAPARPDRCPVLPMSQGASPKYRNSAARSKPISQSGALTHMIPAPQQLLSNRRAPIKSP